LNVDENGGVSLYEDTGTTAKFFWDASAESLGIGTSSPDELLHLSGGTNCILKLDTRDTALSLDQELGVVQFYQNDLTAGGTGVGAKIRGRSTYRASSGTYFGNGMALDFNVSSDAVNSNANVTAMSIIPGGNVGIGTSSPQTLLDVSEFGGTPTIRITNSDGTFSAGQDIGKFEFFCNDQSTPGARVASYILSQAAGTQGGGDLQFATSANGGTVTEAMRIDASGNLLVGTTDTNVSDNTTGGGININGDGEIKAAKNGTVLNLNRLTTDGEIIRFKKGGTTVGSIGSRGGDAYFASTTQGVRPLDAASAFVPTDSVGAGNDASVDLGTTSSGTIRWRDLYLSGNTYLSNGSNLKFKDSGGTSRDILTFDSSNNIVYAPAGAGVNNHIWKRNGSEKMRLDTVGNLLVGTTSAPDARAKARISTGAQIGARVISNQGEIYNSGNGRTFTITGGSNGLVTYVSFTAVNHNGMVRKYYYCTNSSGNWTVTERESHTSGTAPTVTVSGSGTATATINVVGAGSNPNFFTGGMIQFEYHSSYVSFA
jgi:hypothetical protein